MKTSPITCANCNLETICIPRSLGSDQVQELAPLIRRHHRRQKGETIYHAGGSFKGVIALRSGSVKLVAVSIEGEELIVDVILPGELIGFDGVSEGIHRLSAIALDDAGFCLLDANQLQRLGQRAPYLHHLVLQRACETFDRQVKRLLHSRQTSECRVAVFLVDISDRLKLRGYSELEFRVSLSREDIGNYLGLAHETVSRVLRLFQDRGWVDIKARNVCIRDKKALTRLVRD